MLAPDTIPWFVAIPLAIVLTVIWLAWEIHDATQIPSDHPETPTGLDVLEATGRHPH